MVIPDEPRRRSSPRLGAPAFAGIAAFLAVAILAGSLPAAAAAGRGDGARRPSGSTRSLGSAAGALGAAVRPAPASAGRHRRTARRDERLATRSGRGSAPRRIVQRPALRPSAGRHHTAQPTSRVGHRHDSAAISATKCAERVHRITRYAYVRSADSRIVTDRFTTVDNRDRAREAKLRAERAPLWDLPYYMHFFDVRFQQYQHSSSRILKQLTTFAGAACTMTRAEVRSTWQQIRASNADVRAKRRYLAHSAHNAHRSLVFVRKWYRHHRHH